MNLLTLLLGDASFRRPAFSPRQAPCTARPLAADDPPEGAFMPACNPWLLRLGQGWLFVVLNFTTFRRRHKILLPATCALLSPFSRVLTFHSDPAGTWDRTDRRHLDPIPLAVNPLFY